MYKVQINVNKVDTSGRAVYGLGLWPHACWDCGFCCRRHGCLSLV